MCSLTSLLMPMSIGSYGIGTQAAAQRARGLEDLFTRITEAALGHFSHRRLTLLDPRVGDYSCQLRAAHIQQISEKGELPAKGSDEEKFLVLSHLLTITRDSTNPLSEMNPLNLRAFIGVEGGSITDDDLLEITWAAKRALANFSVATLQQAAKSLAHVPGGKLLAQMVHDRNCVTSSSLKSSPCFYNLWTLLERVRGQGLPIIMSVERRLPDGQRIAPRIVIPLMSRNQRTFSLQTRGELTANQHKAAMVFRGFCRCQPDAIESVGSFVTRLLGEEDGLGRFPQSRAMEILLANGAACSQYAGKGQKTPIPFFEKTGEGKKGKVYLRKVLDSLLQQHREHPDTPIEKLINEAPAGSMVFAAKKQLWNDLKLVEIAESYVSFKFLKQRAIGEGFCDDNPGLFALEHILPNTIGEEAELATASFFEVARA